MSHTTQSRVPMNDASVEEERVMLREWCHWAAQNGGSFSVENYYNNAWYTTYTINWPDVEPGEVWPDDTPREQLK